MAFGSGNNFTRYADQTGASAIVRDNGLLCSTDDDGNSLLPLGGSDGTFRHETVLFARKMMPQWQKLFRGQGTDLTPATEASLSVAPATPVIDLNYNNGVYTVTNAKIALNPVTPGATTYNPVLGAVDSLSVPWMIRGRFIMKASTFGGAGTFCVFLSMDGSSVGGGGGGHAIQMMSTGTSSTTQVYVWLFNAAFPGGVQFSGGPDLLLAGPGGIPVNQGFTLAMWFDMQSLRWAINDKFNPLNVITVPNFDAFPSDATAANTQNDAGTANFRVDALAFASVPS